MPPMLTNELTDTAIRKAKHGEKSVKMSDGGGPLRRCSGRAGGRVQSARQVSAATDRARRSMAANSSGLTGRLVR